MLLLPSFINAAQESAKSDTIKTLQKAKEHISSLISFLKSKMNRTLKLKQNTKHVFTTRYDSRNRRIIAIPAKRDSVFWNKVRKLYTKPGSRTRTKTSIYIKPEENQTAQ